MLRRDVADRTEFVMFTLWESLDAVKAFAGDDYERAVYYPRTTAISSSATSGRAIMRSSTPHPSPADEHAWRVLMKSAISARFVAAIESRWWTRRNPSASLAARQGRGDV